MTRRNFAAELQAARNAQAWAAHERIWEERRMADVEQDELELSVIESYGVAKITTEIVRAVDSNMSDGWLVYAYRDGVRIPNAYETCIKRENAEICAAAMLRRYSAEERFGELD